MLLNHRYRILKDLAEGSFGKTYLAEDTQMPGNQRCVIKQLKPINDDRPGVVELIQDRFAREAAVLEAVGKGHSQIPDLLAYFETEGQFYLVQEWIEGTPLSDLIQTPWPEERVRTLVESSLGALAHIHSQNIIHRDLKPDNIILRQSDHQPCLIDFGAVKELMNTVVVASESQASSVVIGTLGFMSPEQAVGRPNFTSDLYSLGMTAITLLTAKLPLEIPADSLNGRLLWRQFAPNVSDRFAGIITRAIHPHPPTRFASATEMLAVLTQQTLTQQASTQQLLTQQAPETNAITAGTEVSLPVPTSLTPAKTAITPIAAISAAPTQITPAFSSEQTVQSSKKVASPSQQNHANTVAPQKISFSFPAKKIAIALGSLLCSLILGATLIAGYRSFAKADTTIDASSSASLEKAINKLENKVDSRPNNTEANLRLAEGYAQSGEYEAALDTIENVLQSDANNDRALLSKGQLQMYKGEYTEALSTFTQLVEQDSDNKEAVNMLGRTYYELGEYKNALEQFDAAQNLDSDNAAFYLNLATTKQITGNLSAALADSELALEKAGSDQLMQVYNSRGNIYLELADTESAAESWESVLEQAPKNPGEYVLQAFSHIGLGDHQQTMRSVSQALEINPNLSDAYLVRSIVHLSNGRTAKALSDVDTALEQNPNSVNALQTRATINSKKESPDIAAAFGDLAKALEVNPNNPYTLNQRCELHLSTQAIDEAISDCTKAIETNPNYAIAYSQRGQAYITSKRYESAEQDFTRVIEINETISETLEKPQLANIYGSRAFARVELGNTEGAEADMTEAIALDPDNPEYYQLRGMLRFIRENFEGAGQDLKKAQDLYSNQGKENAELNQMIELLEQTGLL
ncbi:MAG: tetratricopeptide repeat protein [Cyanobacteria bacterium J06621_11]